MRALPRPSLQIVILAAGFSRRLGQPKALARVRGVGLLRRTATLVAPFGAARTIVVAPPRAARFAAALRGLRTEIRANPRRDQGLSSSVRAGLAVARARGASAVLFVPVDLSALRARDLARLIGAWRAAPRRLVARRIGAGAGVPLILPRHLFPAGASVRGDSGLRDLARAVAPPSRRLVAMRSAASDVDDAGDLRAARRRWRALDQPRRK